MDERMRWSSERAFVFATAAAAVGLGNMWRFPYMAGENGGGAFILAYLISIVVLGFPIMLMEFGAGRTVQGSPVATFRDKHPHAAIFGWIVVLLTGIIMSYYLVITGWTLGYSVDSILGQLSSFEDFSAQYNSLWYFLVVVAVTTGVLVGGLSGIEQKANYLMPVLIVIIIGLSIYGLTMEGSREALRFLFSPDFSALTKFEIWFFAVGQAFYSLAIGQGYLITYGSYLPEKVNLPRAAGAVTGVETGIALLAGLMIFPMVFTFGLSPDEGSELAFNTMPVVFNEVQFGGILGTVFFTLFFLAALSSCIAGMKVVVTTIREEFKLTNTKAVFAAMTPVFLLGIPSALSFSPLEVMLGERPFLEVVDMFAATQIVVTCGVVGAAIIAWMIPRESLLESIGENRQRSVSWMIFIGRYLPVPVLIISIIRLFL